MDSNGAALMGHFIMASRIRIDTHHVENDLSTS